MREDTQFLGSGGGDTLGIREDTQFLSASTLPHARASDSACDDSGGTLVREDTQFLPRDDDTLGIREDTQFLSPGAQHAPQPPAPAVMPPPPPRLPLPAAARCASFGAPRPTAVASENMPLPAHAPVVTAEEQTARASASLPAVSAFQQTAAGMDIPVSTPPQPIQSEGVPEVPMSCRATSSFKLHVLHITCVPFVTTALNQASLGSLCACCPLQRVCLR